MKKSLISILGALIILTLIVLASYATSTVEYTIEYRGVKNPPETYLYIAHEEIDVVKYLNGRESDRETILAGTAGCRFVEVDEYVVDTAFAEIHCNVEGGAERYVLFAPDLGYRLKVQVDEWSYQEFVETETGEVEEGDWFYSRTLYTR